MPIASAVQKSGHDHLLHPLPVSTSCIFYTPTDRLIAEETPTSAFTLPEHCFLPENEFLCWFCSLFFVLVSPV